MLAKATQRIRTIRFTTRTAIILFIVLAGVARLGLGTTCSFGAGEITIMCPLGYLQLSLANRSLMPGLLISTAVVIVAAVLLGRSFCGWGCPAGLARSVFKRDRVKPAPAPAPDDGGKLPGWTRYAVLGGTLASSFAFGFPVFCAICPVGLSFGLLFALVRLVETRQPTLELLFIPAMLAVELLVLRKWCKSLCPLGALLGLLGSRSRVLLPFVNAEKCLASAQGVDCHACARACPESIDPRQSAPAAVAEDCTRCLECTGTCPTGAVSVPVLAEHPGEQAVAGR